MYLEVKVVWEVQFRWAGGLALLLAGSYVCEMGTITANVRHQPKDLKSKEQDSSQMELLLEGGLSPILFSVDEALEEACGSH